MLRSPRHSSEKCGVRLVEIVELNDHSHICPPIYSNYSSTWHSHQFRHRENFDQHRSALFANRRPPQSLRENLNQQTPFRQLPSQNPHSPVTSARPHSHCRPTPLLDLWRLSQPTHRLLYLVHARHVPPNRRHVTAGQYFGSRNSLAPPAQHDC